MQVYNQIEKGIVVALKANYYIVEINSNVSSSKLSEIFFEYPICIYNELTISFFVRLILIINLYYL